MDVMKWEGRGTRDGLMRASAISATAVLVLLSACAGEDPTATSPKGQATASPSPQATTPVEPECIDLTGSPTVEIVMHDYVFDPRCAIVSAEQKLTFVNQSQFRHSFTVPKLDFVVLSGKTKTTKVQVGAVLEPRREPYIYPCKYHPVMKGKLRVQ